MTRKDFAIRQIAGPVDDVDTRGIMVGRHCREYLVLTPAGNKLKLLVFETPGGREPDVANPPDPLLRGSALLDAMLHPGFPGNRPPFDISADVPPIPEQP